MDDLLTSWVNLCSYLGQMIPFSLGHMGHQIGNRIIRFIFLKMVTKDLYCLLTLDYHSSDNNSVLVVLETVSTLEPKNSQHIDVFNHVKATPN